MFDVKKVELEWAGKNLTIETGKIARQADASVDCNLWWNNSNDKCCCCKKSKA